MTNTTVVVWDQFSKMENKIASFKDEVTLISISSESDKESATATKSQLQKFRKNTDLIRKDATAPYRDYVSKVNNKGKEIIDQIKDIENIVDGKLLAYSEEIERKRKERAEKVQLYIRRIYDCTTLESIDDVISLVDIDDSKITLAATQKRQSITDDLRRKEEERKRKEEEKKLEELRLAAEEKQKEQDNKDATEAAAAQKALAEAAAKVEEARRQRELEQRKKEQNEADVLEEVEREVVEQRIIGKQEQQSTKVKGKRTQLQFEVIDPALVPDQYKTVDEKKIRAALKAKLVPNIPGVKHDRVDRVW